MRRSVVLATVISLVMILSAMGLASGRSIPASPSNTLGPAAAAEFQRDTQGPHSTPVLVRGTPPPTVISHWYAGSALSVSAGTTSAREVSVQLTVPSANISSETNQFYYVLLSVWDNIGSYDQIGIANAFGVWGFTYSFTSFCAQNYYFNPDYFNLVPGTTYTFSMLISDGYVYWNVYQGATYIGGLSVITGATAFNVSTYYTCDDSTYYDFTNYEEVYYTQQTTPDFSFRFAATQVDGLNAPMKAFTTSGTPSRVHVKVTQSSASTTLENEQFDLLYTGTSVDLVYLPVGTSTYFFTVQTERLTVRSHLTSCQLVSEGWSFSGWVGNPSPPFTSVQTLYVNTSAPAGTYLEYLFAYNSGAGHVGCSGDYTFVTLEVILF